MATYDPNRLPRGVNFYAAYGYDRCAHARRDAEWLAARRADPAVRVTIVWRGQNLIAATPAPAALTLAAPEVFAALDPMAEVILLGSVDSQPDDTVNGVAGALHFAVDLSHHDDPLSTPGLGELMSRAGGSFANLRDVGPLLAHTDGAVLAYARALSWWHQRTRFCGVCGSRTESVEAGHVRRCTNADCAAEHYPRTDPAVIVLVVDGERCLLGRSARFPPGMFSTLAGFVEPGESLEDCVAREIFEESAVRVTQVRYHSSQPWPFPQSLMIGFHARAASTEIRIDQDELVECFWAERSMVLNPPQDGSFALPRVDSIARRLIEDWAHGRVKI